jgi:hypothetical protein
MTFPAKFTQFLMPDGDQKAIEIDMPDGVREQYDAIHAADCRLTTEMLRTEAIAIYITDREAEDDFFCKVIPNGPEVPKAIEKMIREFDVNELKKWRVELEKEEEEDDATIKMGQTASAALKG